MSNEMISVSRYKLKTLIAQCLDEAGGNPDLILEELRTLLAKPAEQHQGEPVAWTVRGVNGYIDPSYSTCFKDEAESWPESLVDGCEVIPLYTRPAEQPAQKYDDTLLPFVALMRKELHANASQGDRPGWLAMSSDTCLLEIIYHFGKLQASVKRGDSDGMAEYGADVANMCMMLLDICGVLAFVEKDAPVAFPGYPPVQQDRQLASFGVLAGESEIIGERCMDGGTCHHRCTDNCFRKDCCVPLGGSGLNDDWSKP